MKTLDEERYVFFHLCVSDLQECQETLNLLVDVENNSLQKAIIKSAIVAYARPFSGNDSVYRSDGRKWRLVNKFYPPNYADIHYQAIEYRNNFIAHSAIPYITPEILKAPRSGYAIGCNTPKLQELINLSKPLHEACDEVIGKLSVEIRDLVRLL